MLLEDDGLIGDLRIDAMWRVLGRDGFVSRVKDARTLFERLGLSNDPGLLAEEHDVARTRQVGIAEAEAKTKLVTA
jgi:hypothetical protein